MVRILTDVIPCLLSLLREKVDISAKATIVLAMLINEDENLQVKLALETDALKRLVEILEKPHSSGVEKAKEAALSCISALGSMREECRKSIIETKPIVQLVVSALKEGRYETKLIACHCARVLSRSVKALRTVLIDNGIGDPLVKIMELDDTTLRTAACAVLCNLVLEFSPMRKLIIDKNVLVILSDMINNAEDQVIRLNALWALKNLSYQADPETKAAITRVFPYNVLVRYQW